jgi:hypothetical protein
MSDNPESTVRYEEPAAGVARIVLARAGKHQVKPTA